MPDPLMVSPTEAARLLGIGRSTMYELLKIGAIPYKRIGADRRIPFVALKAYAERDLVQAEV